MIVYIYDGSFEGLLTAIYESYYRKDKPQRISVIKNLQTGLLDEYIYIDTDAAKSDRVYYSIEKKISVEALRNVYYVFLSNTEEPGTVIYDYLRFGWKVGRKVDLYMSDDRVLKVHRISRRVGHEVHIMTGFVRFRKLEGNIYYAPIKPDNNIVELLAPHFAERLSDQNWVIHDTGRDIAAVYDRREWVIVNTSVDSIPAPDENELMFQELWKAFYNSIAIANRTNPKLQKRLMPVRYWRYLVEKSV